MIVLTLAKQVAIPEGLVDQIEVDGKVIWRRQKFQIIGDLIDWVAWSKIETSAWDDGSYGEHDFSDDSYYEQDGQMHCTHCGMGEFEDGADSSCDSNWIPAIDFEWKDGHLTLHNPDDLSQTASVIYTQNNTPNIYQYEGWLFKGADGTWYQVTNSSGLHNDVEIVEGDSGIYANLLFQISAVYPVKLFVDIEEGDDDKTATCTVWGKEITFEKGMTWGEFVVSKYNPVGVIENPGENEWATWCCEGAWYICPYTTSDGIDCFTAGVCCGPPNENVIYDPNGEYVTRDDTIVAGWNYDTGAEPSGGSHSCPRCGSSNLSDSGSGCLDCGWEDNAQGGQCDECGEYLNADGTCPNGCEPGRIPEDEDTCIYCGSSIGDDGICTHCGYNTTGHCLACGTELDGCVCPNCGQTYHHSEGPDCVGCGKENIWE